VAGSIRCDSSKSFDKPRIHNVEGSFGAALSPQILEAPFKKGQTPKSPFQKGANPQKPLSKRG